MAEYKTIITLVGQGKIAAAIAAGGAVQITTIAVGDGGGSVTQPDESMTGLVNEVWRGPVQSYENGTGGDARNIDIIGVVPADVGGWTAREMATYDADGDMIAVCNMPESQKTLPESGAGTELTLTMRLRVASAEAVEVLIDPSKTVVLKEELEEHDRNPEAHEAIRGMISEAIDKAVEAYDKADKIVTYRAATLVVGHVNSGHTYAQVPYLCTGTDDQDVINEAFAALPSGYRGKVFLLDGTYQLSSTVFVLNYATLEGMGDSTILRKNFSGADTYAVYVQRNARLCNVAINGNNNAGYGIYMAGDNIKVLGNTVENNGTAEIYQRGSYWNIIANNYLSPNVFGIQTVGGRGVIANNVIDSCLIGIGADSAVYTAITGNHITGVSQGASIAISGGRGNSVTGNVCYCSFGSTFGVTGILLDEESTDNTVSGNTCIGYDVIVSDAGTNNTVEANGGA